MPYRVEVGPLPATVRSAAAWRDVQQLECRVIAQARNDGWSAPIRCRSGSQRCSALGGDLVQHAALTHREALTLQSGSNKNLTKEGTITNKRAPSLWRNSDPTPTSTKYMESASDW